MLAEDEQLIAQDGPAATLADIPGVFGATEDDTNKLRIISLTEVRYPMSNLASVAFCKAGECPQAAGVLSMAVLQCSSHGDP